jgi:hypothetical protein
VPVRVDKIFRSVVTEVPLAVNELSSGAFIGNAVAILRKPRF